MRPVAVPPELAGRFPIRPNGRRAVGTTVKSSAPLNVSVLVARLMQTLETKLPDLSEAKSRNEVLSQGTLEQPS